jgi:hypothetical protein
MKGEQNDKGVLVQVVVEGAEKLRQKKRQEAPCVQQRELMTHARTPLRSSASQAKRRSEEGSKRTPERPR